MMLIPQLISSLQNLGEGSVVVVFEGEQEAIDGDVLTIGAMTYNPSLGAIAIHVSKED